MMLESEVIPFFPKQDAYRQTIGVEQEPITWT